jgi:hypothetical protein
MQLTKTHQTKKSDKMQQNEIKMMIAGYKRHMYAKKKLIK